MSLRGLGTLYPDKATGILIFGYWKDGMQYRERTHTKDPAEAERYRQKRLRELTPLPQGFHERGSAVTVNELLDLTEAACRQRRRGYANNLKSKLRRVRAELGALAIGEVTAEVVESFRARSETERFSGWTIADDLTWLKRALSLALRAGLIDSAPDVSIEWQDVRAGRHNARPAVGRPVRPPRPKLEIPEIPSTITTCTELRLLHLRDRLMAGTDPTASWWHHWLRVMEHFHDTDPRTIRVAQIENYKAKRLQEGAARQTIDTELSVLRRGFNLAIQLELLERKPYFKLFHPQNARQGFLRPEKYRELLSTLDTLQPVLADIVRLYYCLGWRRREVLELTWDEVDLEAATLTLPASRTKNRTPRRIQIAGTILEILRRRAEAKRGPFVFHRKGKPVRWFYKSWQRAIKARGLDGLLVHDLRRSFARAGVQAGVHQHILMAVAGMKTPSIFQRYNIVDESQIADAVERVSAYAEGKSSAAPPAATMTAH